VESDSIKIADKTGDKVYTFSFSISDEDVENLDIKTATSSMGLFSSIIQSENANTIYTVSYTPNVEGRHELKINVQDRFKRTGEVSFSLYAFENLAPKSMLEIDRLPDVNLREYMIDASNSYDMDEKYGGAVGLYKFFIGEQEITLQESALKFVFPASLTQVKIGLQVMDNDGTWSERVEDEIGF
jgi:hypothetical protein